MNYVRVYSLHVSRIVLGELRQATWALSVVSPSACNYVPVQLRLSRFLHGLSSSI